MKGIPPDEIETFGGLLEEGDNLLELGNKTDKDGVPYRKLYGPLIYYQSLDWNGSDGALKYDMNFALDPVTDFNPPGPFDWVTNFGFTEHVTNQEACWANVHRFIRVGGRLVFCMPAPGQWEQHGFYQPRLPWYEQFAELNGYEMELARVNTDRVRWTIIGRYKKLRDKPFRMPGDHLMHRTKRRMTNKDRS